MNYRVTVAAAVLLLLGLGAFLIPSVRNVVIRAVPTSVPSSPAAPVSKSQLAPVKVRLKWVHYAQFTGLYVAQQKGFYEDEGLDVTLLPFDSANPSLVDQLDKGEVDFATVNQIEVLQGVSQGKKVKALAATYQLSPYAILSRPESKIETPIDFRGKKLGLTGGTDNSRLMYEVMMKHYGVDAKSVTFVPLDFDTANNYINRKADTFNFYRIDEVYQLKQKGVPYSLLLPEKYGLETYESIIVSSDALIGKNPELVRKFLRATLKGWEYALAHVDEAAAITMPYITTPSYDDLDYQKFILEASGPLIRTSPTQKIGAMDFLHWQRLYQAMHESGFIETEFDVTSAYTTKFLP